MFKIKFPTKRIFRIFPILRINGMAAFCNLFMERPLYIHRNTNAALHINSNETYHSCSLILLPSNNSVVVL